MKRVKFILSTLIMLCVCAPDLWAEKITDPNQIISGQTYYIGASLGSTDYYLSVDGSALSTAAKGTAVTDKTAAARFVVTMDNGWVFAFADSPYYLGLISSKSNGNVNVSADAKPFSATTTNGLLHLTMNGYSLQRNNSATTSNFGSYASGQTDVWLELVEQDYTQPTDTTGTTGGTTTGGTTTQPTDSTWTQPTDTTGTTGGTTTGGTTTQPTDTTSHPNMNVLVDVLSQSVTGITGTSYAEFKNVYASTNAAYSGQCAGGNSSIQLRATSPSGVVTTASAGIATKVDVEWQSTTVAGRTLQVYGSHTAYASASDLYSSNSNGTLLGTIVCGTSTSLSLDGNYEYIGLRSASGAMYLTSVTITWEVPGTTQFVEAPSLPESTYFMGNMMVRIPMQDSTTIHYTLDGSDPTPNSSVYTGPFTVYNTTTVKAIAVKNGVASRVATATYTYVPSYSSLEALVADTMLQSGALVDIYFYNVVIDSVAVSASGYRNGLFVMVNGQMIEFYCKDVPADWVAGGTIEGQLQCPWKLYNGIWELCPTSWNGITYKAPEITNPDTNPTDTTTTSDGRPAGTEGWYKIVVDNPLGNQGIICWMSHAYDFSTWTQPDTTSVVVPSDKISSMSYEAYVRPGAGVALAWMNFSNTFQSGDTVFLTCNDPRYDGIGYELLDRDASSIMNIYPEGDMTFTSYVKETQPTDTTGTSDGRPAGTEGWYKIVIENQLSADGIIFWMSDAYDFSSWTQPDTGNVVVPRDQNPSEDNSRYVAYVRPGAGAAFAWMNFSQKHQGGDTIYATAADPRYENMALILPYSESAIMNIYPESDLTFTISAQEKQPTDTTNTPTDHPEDTEGWYKVTVDRTVFPWDPYELYFWAGAADSTSQVTEGTPSIEYYTYYVRPGSTMLLGWGVTSQASPLVETGFILNSNDSLYTNLELSASTDSYFIECTPTGDIAFVPAPMPTDTTDNGPVCPEGWYTVTVPASKYVGFGCEEAYNPDNEWGYGEGLQRYDQEDGGMTLFVRPGAEFWLYINQKYDAAGEPLYEFNYDYFVTFASSDTAYNGKQEHFGNTLFVHPNGNMNLSVANVEYGYYKVYLSTENNENVNYQPLFEESSNKEPDFQMEESADTIYFLVRKGKALKLQAYVINPEHHFVSWAGNSRLEAVTTPILEYTPTDDDYNLWIYARTSAYEYQSLTLTREDFFTYYSTDYTWYEGVNDEESEDGLIRTITVREGDTIRVEVGIEDFMKGFAYWQSNDSAYNGLTTPELTVVMHKSLRLTPVFENLYWTVVLQNNRYAEIEVLDSTMTEWANDTTMQMLVRKGESFRVGYYSLDEEKVLDHWSTGDTTQVLTYTPSADMVLYMVIKDAFNYNTLTLTREDFYTYYSVEFNWNGNAREDESEDGLIRYITVREGDTIHVEVGTENEQLGFSHWVSKDPAYNGLTTPQLDVVMNQSLTLTPVFENLYWMVTLPVMENMYFELSLTPEQEIADEYFGILEGESTGSKQIFYVLKGLSIDLAPYYMNEDGGYNYDHLVTLNANDSTNGSKTVLSGRPATFLPQSDLYFSASAEFAYWKVTLDEVYNVVGMQVLSETRRVPGDTLDQLWVLKGESFQVKCEIYDEELMLDHWSTGDTAQVLTYTPSANMILSAILTDRYTYNKVILVTPDDETRVFVDNYYSGTYREGESTVENEQVYLVREGEPLAFYAENSSRIKEFSHWNIEYITASGSRTTNTNTYLNTLVNANAYITRVTPVYENAYYAVRLLGADTLTIVVEEDYSSVTSSHRDYFMEYVTIDTISGLQAPVYYIHKGDSVNFTYEQPWNHPEYVFGHWISSDKRYNNSTVDPICVKPISDMTLGVACQVGYWRIYIPEEEGRIVDIFDAEEYDNPQVAPEPRTAARVRYANDRNVFLTREEHDSTATWFFYAKKDVRVVAVAVEMLNNPLYHLDHWVSDNDSVNRRTENPVYFTPSSDMHIDFASAKNVLVVGNDTIALPDSVSSEADAKVTIEITEDKSIVLEIAKNDEGQTTTTMVFDSAQIADAGITSDIATLILEVENTNNIIIPETIEDQIGFHFTGDELIITSNTYDESVSIDMRDTTAMLIIRAAQGLVGNGSNSLTIDGRLIVSSFGPTTLVAAPVRHIPGLTIKPGTPAISGFDTIIVSNRVAIQEVWYANENGGQEQGDPTRCHFNAAQQSFGEVDMQASSFTPATTLVFSDGAFYTDYLEGNIDVATGLIDLRHDAAVEREIDHNYYDILGRQLDGPQQGIYIHEGRVYLRH